jgi:hypothetical protein
MAVATSSQLVPVWLVDQTDGVTAETGVTTPTIQLSKNGATFASPNDGTWVEIGNGLYTVRLNQRDTATAGWLVVRVIKTGVSTETHVLCEVSVSPAEARADYIRGRRR